MKEIISIHIGEIGLNIASKMWPRFQLENSTDDPSFMETLSGQVKPRAILCDLDRDVMDRIRVQKPNLFEHDYMINHYEGSSGVTVRGKYTVGRELKTQINQAMRKQAE